MKTIRVLMIHHLFFPSQAMAAARAWRLVRRLPSLDVEPVIVTGTPPAPSEGDGEDGIEAADGGRIRVHRVRGRDIVLRKGGAQAGLGEGKTPRGKRLKRLVRSFFVPDELFGWIGAWTRAGVDAAAGGVDVVFSSSTPYSAHLAGRRLARELGKPWVLEMRDLWADSPYIPHAKNPLTRPLQERFEAMCIRDARRVVVTTETHARHLVEKHAGLRKAVCVVPNAFEPAGASPVPPRRTSGPLRILYTGNFYGGRSLSALGRAVDAVADGLEGFPSAVLEVAGKTDDLPWEAVLGGRGSNRIVHGFLPTGRIAELQYEVHAGVVHNPPWDTVHVPGKLYEYLGAGLPVLDLTSQEEIPKLCEGTVPCWKVHPDDVQGLAGALRALADWWDGHPAGVPRPGPDHAFSSLSAARSLAEVLREAAP